MLLGRKSQQDNRLRQNLGNGPCFGAQRPFGKVGHPPPMNPPIAKSATHSTTACCKEWLFGPLCCQVEGFNARKTWGPPYLHGSTTLLRPYCYGSATAPIPWASRCPWEWCRSSAVVAPLIRRRGAVWENHRRIAWCVVPGLPGPNPYTNFPDEAGFPTHKRRPGLAFLG